MRGNSLSRWHISSIEMPPDEKNREYKYRFDLVMTATPLSYHDSFKLNQRSTKNKEHHCACGGVLRSVVPSNATLLHSGAEVEMKLRWP